MKRWRDPFLVGVAALTIWSSDSSAAVYKCVAEGGKVTYSDKPCRGDEARAGMDVKGMTYSSEEVTYSNERAANILQSERLAQQVEEAPAAPSQSHGTAPADGAGKARAREVARQAERERDASQKKAAAAGIANGGTPWVPAAGGAVDPKTGEFKVNAAGGYVDAKTGKFIPVPGK